MRSLASNPATERKRRHRFRQANGKTVLVVEVDEIALAEKLIEAGYLSRTGEDGRLELQKALQRMIEDLAIVVSHA